MSLRPGPRPLAGVVCALSLLVLSTRPDAADSTQRKAIAGRGQAAPSADGFVLGQVVDAGTGAPIPRAEVRWRRFENGDQLAQRFTDDAGRFLFRDLPRGLYVFEADALGYLSGGLGQAWPGGPLQPFTLDDNQRTGGLTIRLWREATIAGAVRDETGAPVVEVSVWLLDRRQTADALQVSAGRYDASRTVRTDDRGAYRFSGVSPGDYVVVVPTRSTQRPTTLVGAAMAAGSRVTDGGLGAAGAAVRVGNVLVESQVGGAATTEAPLPLSIGADGRLTGYPTTFHPAARSAGDAAAVSVRAGDDLSGIDVVMAPVAMGGVSGQIVGPDGPVRHLAVHLLPVWAADEEMQAGHETVVTATGADGRFDMIAVPPGAYVVRAWRNESPLAMGREPALLDSTLWGETALTVAEPPGSSVVLTLRSGARISGRVALDGATPPPGTGNLERALGAAFLPSWRLAVSNFIGVHVGADGAFTTQGLPPGDYRPRLPNQFSGFEGWYFESASRGDRDLTIAPIALGAEDVDGVVVRFSDRRTSMAGTVRTASSEPARRAAVIVMPADYRTWIAHGLSPLAGWAQPASQTGTFSMDLRPGDYLVAAVEAAAVADWRRPEVVEALAAVATPLTVASGETRRLDLRIGTAPAVRAAQTMDDSTTRGIR